MVRLVQNPPITHTRKECREMMSQAHLQVRFVGLDAGRETIEASVRPSGEIWTANSGEDGITEMVDTVFDIHPRLVVLQANGNFELPLAGILMTRALPVALVQPLKVREFARAIGRLSRVEQRPAALL